jgi:CRISPR type IV-associated protein Csf2
LFGGGGYMLPSRYSMGPLIPQVEWVDRALHHSLRATMIPIEKLRYKRADDSYGNVPLTHDYILTSRDDVLSGKGQTHIENYEASYEVWFNEVVTGRVAKAKDKAEKDQAAKEGKKVESGGKAISSDVAGFNITEAIVPGLPLQFWLRFTSKASDAQIGLMLLAVRDWANENVIGGASARGYGRFEATIALFDDDHPITGNIFNIQDHATAYALSDAVKPWVDAAEDALKALKVSELEESYATNVAGV